jgi:Na+/proline symporter
VTSANTKCVGVRESVLLYLSWSFQFFLCWEGDRERVGGFAFFVFFSLDFWKRTSRQTRLAGMVSATSRRGLAAGTCCFSWLFSSQQKIDLPTFFVGRRRMRGPEGMGI